MFFDFFFIVTWFANKLQFIVNWNWAILFSKFGIFPFLHNQKKPVIIPFMLCLMFSPKIISLIPTITRPIAIKLIPSQRKPCRYDLKKATEKRAVNIITEPVIKQIYKKICFNLPKSDEGQKRENHQSKVNISWFYAKKQPINYGR